MHILDIYITIFVYATNACPYNHELIVYSNITI